MDIPYLGFLFLIIRNQGFHFTDLIHPLYTIVSLFLMARITKSIYSDDSFQVTKAPLVVFWISSVVYTIRHATLGRYGQGWFYSLFMDLIPADLFIAGYAVYSFIFSPGTILSLLFLWLCLKLSKVINPQNKKNVLFAGLLVVLSPVFGFFYSKYNPISFNDPLGTNPLLLFYGVKSLFAIIPPLILLKGLKSYDNSPTKEYNQYFN